MNLKMQYVTLSGVFCTSHRTFWGETDWGWRRTYEGRRYDQQIFVPRCSSRAWALLNPSRWVEFLVTTRSTLGNCIEKLAEKSTNPKKAGKWDVLEMLLCVSTCFGILLLGGKHKCSEWSESQVQICLQLNKAPQCKQVANCVTSQISSDRKSQTA